MAVLFLVTCFGLGVFCTTTVHAKTYKIKSASDWKKISKKKKGGTFKLMKDITLKKSKYLTINRNRKYVIENKLDVGFAFDGDADRCLAVDDKGNIINGDYIMYICAKYMQERGTLGNSKVVTTIMSNMGLYKALDELGIGYEKTDVGDKYVSENMSRNGHILGGEQSGHIIYGRHANTGDGILTAIKIMEAVTESKQPLSVLASGMTMYPQKLKNVVVTDKDETLADEAVQASVRKVEADLGENGRVLLRKSGTEPLLRVMVEASTEELCEEKVDEIIDAMRTAGKLIKVK